MDITLYSYGIRKHWLRIQSSTDQYLLPDTLKQGSPTYGPWPTTMPLAYPQLAPLARVAGTGTCSSIHVNGSCAHSLITQIKLCACTHALAPHRKPPSSPGYHPGYQPGKVGKCCPLKYISHVSYFEEHQKYKTAYYPKQIKT